jgi:hypothetical protein
MSLLKCIRGHPTLTSISFFGNHLSILESNEESALQLLRSTFQVYRDDRNSSRDNNSSSDRNLMAPTIGGTDHRRIPDTVTDELNPVNHENGMEEGEVHPMDTNDNDNVTRLPSTIKDLDLSFNELCGSRRNNTFLPFVIFALSDCMRDRYTYYVFPCCYHSLNSSLRQSNQSSHLSLQLTLLGCLI